MQCSVTLLLCTTLCSTNGWQPLSTRRTGIIRYAEDAASLQQAADALRAEVASLEATLPRPTMPPPPSTVTELPGSTWRFACRLDDGKSFDFVATMEREMNEDYLKDDANRYREAGPLALLEASPSIRKAFGWLAEDDGPPSEKLLDGVATRVSQLDLASTAAPPPRNDAPKGEFARITISMKEGVLADTDGDLMYLQARVKRGTGSVGLDEGTLTVKRQRPGTRFLFVEYPSLVADLKIVGSFSATPASPRD